MSMHLTSLGFAIACCFMSLSLPVSAAPKSASKASTQGPLIETIRGAQSLPVGGSKGVRQEGVGGRLLVGERIETSASTATRLVYDDGTQLMVGRASTVEILDEKSVPQAVKLSRGDVRAVVKPTQDKKTVKFLVRTKAAVMGVRGTDFAVNTDADGAAAEVHTLEGQVDVAKDDKSLFSGKGMAVKADQFVKANRGAISVPKAFDRAGFLNALKGRQPDLPDLASMTPKPAAELEKLKGQIPAAPQLPKAPQVPSLPKAPEVPQVPKLKNPFGR